MWKVGQSSDEQKLQRVLSSGKEEQHIIDYQRVYQASVSDGGITNAAFQSAW